MDTLIKKKMIQHIVHTFQCEHIAKSAIDFVDYQASKRDFLFGSLTVLHFEMFNGEDTDIYSAAAAIEILILATDIFDDLQDQDQFDAPWQNVDRSIVLNLSVGLLLLSKKILENSNEKCTNLMSETYYSLIFRALNGQHADLLNRVEDEKHYLSIIERKSGSLTALACLTGALFTNTKQHTIIKKYGEKMGIVAQLFNDLNDVYEWDSKSDIWLKKKTLPILYMLTIGEDSLIKQYYNSSQTFGEIYEKKAEVMKEMEQLGAIHYTKAIIGLYRNQAINLIDQLDVSFHYKEKLKTMI